jgi:glycosyltransferase involved in cell wall biosynthesis
LGYVDDAQLLDLFTRCRVVVNAARYDNGTYSLIEATYFGKPTVCSDYPAAKNYTVATGVEPLYFPVEDAVALAEAVRLRFAAITAGRGIRTAKAERSASTLTRAMPRRFTNNCGL